MLTTLRSIPQFLKGLKAFVTIVRDPRKTEAVFEMASEVHDPRFLDPLAAHLRQGLQPLAALAAGPRLGNIDLAALSVLPDGSLGKVFSTHMTSLGLDPNFFPKYDVANDYDYIRVHLYETHDLWHIVTGFNTEVSGELGLQAFYLAQMPMPLPFLLLAGGLLNTMFFHFEDRESVLSAITRGWQMGRTAKSLFGVNWTKLWSLPLAQVRYDFGLTSTDQLPAERPQLSLATR